MPDQELNLILRLKDEATKQLSSIRNQVTVAAAAMAAAGFQAGAEWDRATKTIVEGTGATGDALKGLQSDYQAVARYGPQAATAIADLNTHLGLQGAELREVAEAALKAKVDTNAFGDVASQLGLDAQGAAQFLDQLVTASQGTGVSVDQLTNTIGKNSARWQAAGGGMDALAATVVKAADEFGPAGLRGAMSEVMEEVDKGVIPAVASLGDQLGDTTGAVERTYEAGKTWRDVLREQKDALLASIGPYGDMAGGIGTAAAGFLQLIPVLKGSAIAQKALNLAMRLNPIGLIITAIALAGAAIWKWRDQIWNFITGAWQGLMDGLRAGYNWIAKWIPGMEQLEEVTVAETVATDAAAESVEDFGAAAQEVATTDAPSLIEALGSASGTGGVAGAARAATESVEDMAQAYADAADTLTPDMVTEIADRIEQEWGSRTIATGKTQGLLFMEAYEDEAKRLTPGQASEIAARVAAEYQAAGPTFAAGGEVAAEETVGGFERFGGWKGMMSGASAAIGAFATGGWKAGIMSMAQTALSFLPPGMAQAAQAALAAFSAVWKFFKRPSEAELRARKDVDDYEAAVIEGLSETQIAEAKSAGWKSWEDAAFLIGIRDMYVEAGRSAAEAEADVARYWEALKAGDQGAIDAMQADWDELGVSIDDVAASAQAAWDAAAGAAVGAFNAAQSAGESAYDATMEAAIEAGATEEEATAQALAAQLAASAEVLAAKGLEYARIAAFDAAMALGANATAEERAAAARSAAQAALESWDAAMVAVVASDRAATDAIAGTSTSTANHLIAETERAATAQESAISTAADHIQMSLDSISAPSITIPVHYSDPGFRPDIGDIGDISAGHVPTRHAGGPVSAGSTYSTIPGEVFVPRQSGTVINPGLIDYDRLGAAVARAVAASPPTIAQNPVTDAILRNMPRREALRGWAPA